MIHTCDLPGGGDFTALPADFTDALIADALTRRRGAHSVDVAVRATDREPGPDSASGTLVEGPAGDVARWLTRGIASPGLRAVPAGRLPELHPWL